MLFIFKFYIELTYTAIKYFAYILLYIYTHMYTYTHYQVLSYICKGNQWCLNTNIWHWYYILNTVGIILRLSWECYNFIWNTLESSWWVWNDVKDKWVWELRNVLPKSGSLQSGFSEPFRFCGNENLLHGAVLSGSGLCIISCSCSWKYRNLVWSCSDYTGAFLGMKCRREQRLEIVGCFITQLDQQTWTPGHGHTRGGTGLPVA